MRRPRLMVLALALTTGCIGNIIGGGDDDGDGPYPEGPRNFCESGAADVPGPRLLRRLTSEELTASVRAAFGLPAAEWAGPALPADPAASNGFTNNVDRLVIDAGYADALLGTAESVADAVIKPARLPQVLPCAATGGAACARTYLDTIGRRLFRRPLTDEERQRYLMLHDKITASASFATWVRWATVALVQSPNFVYRSELGAPDGDGYKLTGYEIATALAYNLTGGPPSDALLDQAARGALDTPAGVEAAARELALDPASGAPRPAVRKMFLAFTDQWLGLSVLSNVVKATDIFPGFTPAVRTAMRTETDAFIQHVVFDQRGDVGDLLTAPVSVVDATMAGYYGWAGSGVVTRPEGWGVGLLAQGSILAIKAGNTFTSPTKRGQLVRERLLCYDIPPPPPVVGDIPPATGNETTRQRYEQHASNEACAGCHSLMDSIGFTFEHLDAGGRFRAMEGSFPIDDSGKIVLASGDVSVTGPTQLAEALAGKPDTAVCMAVYMASQSYGLDHHDTSCLVTSLADRLAKGEIGIFDYYLGLTTTPHFTRRVDSAE